MIMAAVNKMRSLLKEYHESVEKLENNNKEPIDFLVIYYEVRF
jgi:hypothetical protein